MEKDKVTALGKARMSKLSKGNTKEIKEMATVFIRGLMVILIKDNSNMI
jgi:hypothetical protein